MPSVPRYPATPSTAQFVEDTASRPEPKAEQTPSSADRTVKVTAEDARAIRADYAAGKWSQTDLAYIYGVTQNTVSRIVNSQSHNFPTPTEHDS